jgi:hypothetical protein
MQESIPELPPELLQVPQTGLVLGSAELSRSSPDAVPPRTPRRFCACANPGATCDSKENGRDSAPSF